MPGYKQTEAGVIPEDWEVKQIREIAKVKGGKRLPLGKSLVDTVTPHPYIRVTDMHLGSVNLANIRYVPEDAYPSIKNYRISSDDIFVSVAGTLGIVGKVPKEIDGANLTENADKITEIQCDRDYLLCCLIDERIQNGIVAQQTQGAQPKLALNRIEGFVIPLPPLPEQRAIAAALSDTDALLSSLDRLLAKKRDIKQAVMQQLLMGKQRLPGFSGEWEMMRLGDIASMGSGGTPPSKIASYYGGNLPWVSVADMTSSGKYVCETERNLTMQGLQNSSAKLFPTGTILYAMYASIGECSIATAEVCTSQAILGIRVGDKILGDYLYFYLLYKKAQVKEMGQQGTQSNINKGMVENLKIPLPSIKEQSSISAVLTDMDAEVATLQHRRDKTRAVKQGMMQELLTGRTRLV